MINDAQLNYWANRYIALHIHDHGIAFEDFIAAPHAIVARTRATQFRPLLPSQRAVAQRLGHTATHAPTAHVFNIHQRRAAS